MKKNIMSMLCALLLNSSLVQTSPFPEPQRVNASDSIIHLSTLEKNQESESQCSFCKKYATALWIGGGIIGVLGTAFWLVKKFRQAARPNFDPSNGVDDNNKPVTEKKKF